MSSLVNMGDMMTQPGLSEAWRNENSSTLSSMKWPSTAFDLSCASLGSEYASVMSTESPRFTFTTASAIGGCATGGDQQGA